MANGAYTAADWMAAKRDLDRIMFPNGREAYVIELDEKIAALDHLAVGTRIEKRARPAFWNNPRKGPSK